MWVPRVDLRKESIFPRILTDFPQESPGPRANFKNFRKSMIYGFRGSAKHFTRVPRAEFRQESGFPRISVDFPREKSRSAGGFWKYSKNLKFTVLAGPLVLYIYIKENKTFWWRRRRLPSIRLKTAVSAVFPVFQAHFLRFSWPDPHQFVPLDEFYKMEEEILKNVKK